MLRDIIERTRDKELKRAIQNAFALLRDDAITAICLELANGYGSEKAAEIIALVGPEEARVACLIPDKFAPGVLADADVAAKVLTAVAAVAGKPAASKEDVKNVVRSFDVPAASQVVNNLDKEITGALEWGTVARIIANVGISLLSKKLPMLRYAGRSQEFIRTAATAAGAALGFAKGASAPPLPLPPIQEN